MSAPQVEWFPIPGKEDLNLPLSQGAAAGNLVIMTQVPQQADGTMNTGSVAEQTRQVLNNFKTELEKVGSSLDQVLSITVYILNIDDFQEMAAVWSEFFPGRGPGRTTVGVSGLTPPGLQVEMTAFAIRDTE